MKVNKPKILFVTYGGGHSRMILPIVLLLQKFEIDIHVLALTTAGALFKAHNIPFTSFKDYLDPNNKEAIKWGEKLLADMQYINESIPIDETIAYLGLSFLDLITQLGEEEATKLYKKNNRQAFLPIYTLEKIINIINPSLVVTTNSPRAEKAAILVAKKKNITTLSLADLFGLCESYIMESDFIAVLCEQTIANLKDTGVKANFVITGNPNFDEFLFNRQNYTNHQLEGILWIDMPAYWNLATNELHYRDENEIISDLNVIKNAAASNNCKLFIRPHPSQDRRIFFNWINKQSNYEIQLVDDLELLQLLMRKLIVVGYTSTVLLQAIYVGRTVVQINCQKQSSDLPIGELGLAWLVRHEDELISKITEACNNNIQGKKLYDSFNEYFPKKFAAPAIVELIVSLL